MTLPQIVKEALETTSESFIHLVEDCAGSLQSENGKIGNFDISGRLVKLEPHGEALIIGDLHGDLESLMDVLKESDFLQKMNQNSDATLVFLGDYGDRGAFSAEVYYTVLKLKLLYPTQIILMRGNHEGPDDLLASPHDLPTQFQARFGAKGTEAYAKIRELFPLLYNAVLAEERYLMVHGGLSPQIKTAEDLAYAHLKHPKQSILEDILWSDPNERVRNVVPSPRGAGRLFGENVTRNVLKKLNAKILIRGHEPCEEGYKIDHHGKVLTLFSRKGLPYFNMYGAYLNVNLSDTFESAQQLIPYVHKF